MLVLLLLIATQVNHFSLFYIFIYIVKSSKMIYDRFFDPSVVIWRACQLASPVHCIGEESRAEPSIFSRPRNHYHSKKKKVYSFFSSPSKIVRSRSNRLISSQELLTWPWKKGCIISHHDELIKRRLVRRSFFNPFFTQHVQSGLRKDSGAPDATRRKGWHMISHGKTQHCFFSFSLLLLWTGRLAWPGIFNLVACVGGVAPEICTQQVDNKTS